MKGPLAAAVEALRAAREAGVTFGGDIVLCAHGLHEAPGGVAEDLAAALAEGAVTGDAAIVLELAHDALPIVGLGSGIYRARFYRDGPVTHELMTPEGTPNPAFAAAEAALVLRELDAELRRSAVELAGPESLFLGQLHAGDFYNRFTDEARLEGTRRYAPERTADEVGAEILARLQPVARRNGLQLDFSFTRVRDGFRVSLGHPLVEALQQAYAQEVGHPLPVTGTRLVADAPVFQSVAGIPCLYHGLNGDGAHADVESVLEGELARGSRVYLRTLAHYLNTVGGASGAGAGSGTG